MRLFIKTTLLIPLLILMMSGTSSCSTDSFSVDDSLWIWATVAEEGKSFVTDGGKTMWVVTSATTYKPKNERVQISCTILDEKIDGYDYAIRLNGYLADVLTKDVMYIHPEDTHKQDSIANDPIRVHAIWEGGGFLNIEFAYQGTVTVPHMLNLVSAKEDLGVSDDVVELEFRHNRNSDSPNHNVQGEVCFRLEPYRIQGRDKVAFKIKVQMSETDTQIFDVLYDYNSGASDEFQEKTVYPR